jgi:hypothetical protein
MKEPLTFGDRFSDNLALLPPADAVAAIELIGPAGAPLGLIENKPGQAGSLRVYLWLAQQFGAITPEAAQLGLRIYAEHTADARNNPGKHPNIDRLFAIESGEQALQVAVR